MKRSNEPVFWLLFGAGGMLAALLGTAMVLITGIAGPLGAFGAFGEGFSYSNALAIARHPLGKLFMLAVVSLLAWHAAHRILHTLHDLGVRRRPMLALLCYGAALVVSVVVAASLVVVGF